MYGVNLSTSAAPDHDPVRDAVEAQNLGFDFVSATDHPLGTHPTNELWTMLTWVAARTEHVKLLTRVMAAPFRNPVVVAKMAETLHRLSNGRLILGLGAGGSDAEIGALGAPVLSPRAKIDALHEAVNVIRGVWTTPAFSFGGQHHTADDVTIDPRPTDPPPIWLGTFGPHALDITGTVADGWIPSLGYAKTSELPRMKDRVLSTAAQAGRDAHDIRCVLNVTVGFQPQVDPDDDIIVGPAPYLVERLTALAESGFSTFNFIARDSDQATYRTLAHQVIPALPHTGTST